MKKINRRQYLLQMGAGTAGLMAASPLVVLGEHREPFPHPQPSTLLWKPTTSLPSRPRVTAIFGGLFGFFYNPDSGNCEVGAHKGDGNHSLMIEVWERSNVGCKRLFSTENGTLPKPKGELNIQISDRSVGEANFYQVGPYDLQKRKDLQPQDFRWLPDLDSDDFYPDNHEKVKDRFKHKIVVKHGTFYTEQRTRSTFERVDPPESQTQNKVDFYQVANYMAAGIVPNQNEDVSFQVDTNSWIVFTNKPGSTFEIHLLNHCYEDAHKECRFNPNDPLEKNRNHFHFMREMLKLPENPKIYGLKLKDKGYSHSDFCQEQSSEGTDEAPCMGAGFGKTKSMP